MLPNKKKDKDTRAVDPDPHGFIFPFGSRGKVVEKNDKCKEIGSNCNFCLHS